MSATAASSSTVRQPTVLKVNDMLYELYKPVGFIEEQIIFIHGLQSGSSEDGYLRAWMRTEDSECWINTWLPDEFPQAQIFSVSYDFIHLDSPVVRDMVGKMLARSMIELAEIGQNCPVILVGHCLGGIVLKQICIQAEELADSGSGLKQYQTFLGHMTGAFFYSNPNSVSFIKSTLNSKEEAPLLEYLELLSKDSARLNVRFSKLRQQYGWKSYAVVPMSEEISSVTTRRPKYSLMETEGSLHFDADTYSILSGEDNFSINKPRHRTACTFVLLLQFMQKNIPFQRNKEESWRTTLGIPTHFVDLQQRVEQIIDFLQLRAEQPSIPPVALVGVGGIGKTTLAKAILVQIHIGFDLVCFVEDVKARLKRHSIHDLMADNLYLGNREKVRLPCVDKKSLHFHMEGKKVLLIMDDVESEEQIGDLLTPDWLGTGSRLIVTTRIRTRKLMPSFTMFEIPMLSLKESETLFLQALEGDTIREIPQDLIQKVLMICAGLPLVLIVIGRYLRFHSSASVWTSAVEKLMKVESSSGADCNEDHLWSRLQISYDDLAHLEREMFLDLAVFHESDTHSLLSNLEVWKAVWKVGSDNSSVVALMDRSFIHLKPVTIRDTSKIIILSMHEQLRDLGKRISRPSGEKPELCRAVWQTEDILHLLSKHQGDKARAEVVVLESLDQNKIRATVQWSSIWKLRQLRLLRLSNVIMSGNETVRFPFRLAYLQLTSCWRDATEKLRGRYWPIRAEDVEGLHQLTVLHLENCSSIRLPPNFHKLSNLKFLTIRGNDLESLPDNFGLLSALEELTLENVRLKQLPSSFHRLPSLQALSLTGCSALEGFRETFARELALRREVSFPRRLFELKRLKLADLDTSTERLQTFGLLKSHQSLVIDGVNFVLEQYKAGSVRILEQLSKLLQKSSIRYLGGLSSKGQLKSPEELMVGIDDLESSRGSIGQFTWATTSTAGATDSVSDSSSLVDSNMERNHVSRRPDAIDLGFHHFDDPFDPKRILFIYTYLDDDDVVELIFFHQEGMAAMFGVAIPFSKAILTRDGDVEIRELGRLMWEQSWTPFSMQSWKLALFDDHSFESGATTRHSCSPAALSAKDTAALFGVGVEGIRCLDHIGHGELQSSPESTYPWKEIISPQDWMKSLFEFLLASDSEDSRRDPQMCESDGKVTGAAGEMTGSASESDAEGTGKAVSLSDQKKLNMDSKGSPVNRTKVADSNQREGESSSESKQLTVEIHWAKPDSKFYLHDDESREVLPRNTASPSPEPVPQEGNTDVRNINDCVLKPRVTLHFLFESDDKRFTTTLGAHFYINPPTDVAVEQEFGWYHDNLHLSFRCTEEGVVEKEIQDLDDEVLTKHERCQIELAHGDEAGSASARRNGPQFKASGGVPGTARLEATYNSSKERSTSEKEWHASSRQSRLTFLTDADFSIHRDEKPCALGYTASLSPPFKHYDVTTTEGREDAIWRGMMKTVPLKIRGNWIVLGDECDANGNPKLCDYEFICRRDLILHKPLQPKQIAPEMRKRSWFWSFMGKGRTAKGDDTSHVFIEEKDEKIKQKLVTRFNVNHSFTHMQRFRRPAAYRWVIGGQSPLNPVENIIRCSRKLA